MKVHDVYEVNIRNFTDLRHLINLRYLIFEGKTTCKVNQKHFEN